MAKSKNHTNNNQSYKNHRNGIKKPKRLKHPSMKGVDPKFLRNLKYAKKGNMKAIRKRNQEKAKRALEAFAQKTEKMEQ
ncbi:PREDICTED: 60S ribosomal protein L29-like [Amphimedon queenslandica]|uniref:60S ribosomal protein L29 n=1 Tax=Amphimedon queenslandica TaxID=400682 RepID=A0A1X7VRC4_AMPQE|nr:PREDICTED: 60S ribosomal protein L29-like [Amphimedon queenslandica]|eukprot:XP_003382991.1 PREDICTED: 60S ribosomal protein L29-like [Amphimedon queenslandica]